MTYDIRYCAFVDILGFSGLIEDLAKGKMTYEVIHAILKRVHKPPLQIARLFTDCDFKAQSISDAVCMSTTPTSGGLSHLLGTLSVLTLDLLKQGYFCRGAVVKGNLYHDDETVFGEALVNAYRLESTVAKYPRIILPRNVALEARKLKDTIDYEDHVRRSEDGPFFLHTLLAMNHPPKDREVRSSFVEYWDDVACTLQRLFDESVDNPRHFEKIQWFAKYWNYVSSQTMGIRHIEGPTFGFALGEA